MVSSSRSVEELTCTTPQRRSNRDQCSNPTRRTRHCLVQKDYVRHAHCAWRQALFSARPTEFATNAGFFLRTSARRPFTLTKSPNFRIIQSVDIGCA